MTVSSAARITPERIVQGLKDARIDFITSLAQDDISDVLRLLDQQQEIAHVHLCREEEGFGICAGAYLGGKNPAILLHNTGFLASANAITSLNLANQFPLLMLVSYSGYFGEQNPWSAGPGETTESTLNALGIRYWILRDAAEVCSVLIAAHQLMHASKRPVAVLLPPLIWA
ncbi:MAG: thiamine pyrophosphate-binding protein [Deltaproteobacteria bacterium]|nr:thiamine pyrophosphate-binding protein [Deltaproteobacteria bacterium]MDZ4345112.1 thiamine pyrophosphate-binding protein [Candidatus Binatia bacterium]